MKHFSNQEIVKLLRKVAAAITLKKGNQFQIRAYENAADSIEHSTADVQDLWEENRLDEVPGIGEGLKEHLSELFKTGKVRHFHALVSDYPEVLYEMLDIPGVGPKTALELTKLGVKSMSSLENGLKQGTLVKKGFSAAISEKILSGLEEVKTRDGRMLLKTAFSFASKILEYLKKCPEVERVDSLGSLRRMVATVGDLDFSASAKNPKKVVDYFVNMPGVNRIIDQGDNRASVVLHSGLQIDLLVGKPQSYGALLQHFTGGKNHNIHLRTLALKHGLSLSEEGVKNLKTGKTISTETEEEFYKLLKMDTPAPEIREDSGEIEAALEHKLPSLVEMGDIKGDLHLHSNYPFEHPSHGPGVDSIEEIIKKALDLKYDYVGISDHPPAFGQVSSTEMTKMIQKRTKVIQGLKKRYKSIHILNGLEIDILGDGALSVPDEALSDLDYCIAGIHSGHRGKSEDITKRILKALENPNVDIISHPTGRLLNERPSFEADWKKVFEYCGKSNKLLEINASPNRLDLRDDLVREALNYRVSFVINSDAHELSQMDNLIFGVSVARRGWAQKKDIINTFEWKKFSERFRIH